MSPELLAAVQEAIELLHTWRGKLVRVEETLARRTGEAWEYDRHGCTRSHFVLVVEFVGWRFSGSALHVEGALGGAECGHQISLDSVDTTSAAGGVITVLGEWAHYTPPAGFDATDTFTYQISDVIGATAVGVVTVVLKDDSDVSQNISADNLGNG